MKLSLILISLTLIIGLIINELYTNLGVITVHVMQYEVQLPLILAVSALIVTLVLLLISYKIIYNIYAVLKRFVLTISNNNPVVAEITFNQALLEESQGNYLKAAKLFIRSAKAIDKPLMNFIKAAACYNEIKDYNKRDEYIMLAYQADLNSIDVVNFNLAKMYLQQEDYARSVSVLNIVKTKNVNFIDYVKLKATLLDKLSNCEQLKTLLPEIIKYQIFNADHIQLLQEKVYLHEINNFAEANYKKILILWKKSPLNVKQNKNIIRAYVNKMLELNLFEYVLEFAKKELATNQVRYIADMVLKLPHHNTQYKIELLDKWRQKDPASYELLFCLGQLYLEQQNWQKARSLFEQSLKIHPNPLTYAALARLAIILGDDKSKLENIEQGLHYLEAMQH